MAISVRLARPEDENALQRVGEEAFAAVRRLYRPGPAALENLSKIAPVLERLVADDNGQVVGTVRYGTFNDCLRVIGLGVVPQFQRRGIARALVEELARLAKEKGCRALALYTITKTGNVPVFERLGFHVVSECPDEYFVSADGEPLTEAYMERSVAQPSAAVDASGVPPRAVPLTRH